jgi:hypothetical protein
MMSFGHKLGLYKAIEGAGPLTSAQVAKRSGCAERYVREWLNCDHDQRLFCGVAAFYRNGYSASHAPRKRDLAYSSVRLNT